MKRLNIIISIIAFASLTLISACKTSSKATSDTTQYKAEVKCFDQVVQSYNDWNSFSASGKLSITSGSRFSTAMQMKMVRNKFIIISIRPVLGIEVGKLYITNDSIFIIDKYNKLFVNESLSQFSMGFPFSIISMQDLFLNRAFTLGGGTITQNDASKINLQNDISTGNWEIIPKEKIKGFTYAFIFNKLNDLIRLAVTPDNIPGKYEVEYSDFLQVDFGRLATNVEISAVQNNKNFGLGVSLNSSTIKWNPVINDTGDVKCDYKKVSLMQYINALKNM